MPGTTIAVQFTSAEEIEVLPLLLRHSSGVMLRDGVYIINSESGEMLRHAGVEFRLLSSNALPRVGSACDAGRRI